VSAQGDTRDTSLLKRALNTPLAFRLLIAAVLGATAAFGQAPYDQPVAFVLAVLAAFVMWRAHTTRGAAALMGWAFGAGYFAHALLWILEPFQVDAARHGWMAPFALLFLSSGLALFWGAAFWCARLLSASAGMLVLTWTGAEILRAYLFTGFPWAGPAQIMIDGPVSRLLAVFGPHGATLCLLAFVWALSLPRAGAAWTMRVGQGALFAGVMLAFYLPQAIAPAPLTDHWVRLVQPNAAQHLKWQPEYAELFFQRQLTLTAQSPLEAEQAPDLVVWPETAIPWQLGAAGLALAEVARASGGVPVALGALRFEGDRLRNSMAVVGPDGALQAIYDKHHLVPFGEYIPFANLAERLGVKGLAVQVAGFSPGTGPELVDFGRLGQALPLICYEAVFAHDVNAAPGRPSFLLQVTNDAWFGTQAGPQQHLAQARMRAIEQGIPLARAANTGISAMIDPYGRIIAQLPLGADGFVDAPLPRPLPPTLYSRTGDAPLIWVLCLALLLGAMRVWRHSLPESD